MRHLNHLLILSALALLPLSTVTAQSHLLRLKEGADVKLKFAQQISSKSASEGEAVNFLVAEDVKVGDVVVIKAGTKAFGAVTYAKRAGLAGKGGELNVRVDYLKMGAIKVRLRGSKSKEGDSKTGQSVGLLALFGPIGLIKHGDEITVAEGTPLSAFIDGEVMLPPASGGNRKGSASVPATPAVK